MSYLLSPPQLPLHETVSCKFILTLCWQCHASCVHCVSFCSLSSGILWCHRSLLIPHASAAYRCMAVNAPKVNPQPSTNVGQNPVHKCFSLLSFGWTILGHCAYVSSGPEWIKSSLPEAGELGNAVLLWFFLLFFFLNSPGSFTHASCKHLSRNYLYPRPCLRLCFRWNLN